MSQWYMLLRSLVLVMCCIFTYTVHAQSLPLKNITEALSPSSQPSKEEVKPQATPDPQQLDVSWWLYIETTSVNQLDERINHLLTRIDTQIAGLPSDTQSLAKPFVGRIRVNLNAYAQLKSKSALDTPAASTFQEQYTISQIIDIVRKSRDNNVRFTSEQADLAEADKQLKVSMRRIDTLLAAYLNTAKTDPKRIVLGLEVMAERSEIAVADERLRIRRLELAHDETRAADSERERDIALARLTVTADDLASINEAIAQAEDVSLEAQERLTREQASSLTAIDANTDDRAATRYRQQRVLRAQVVKGLSEVKLLLLLSERDLLGLYLGNHALDPALLRSELNARLTALSDLKINATAWLTQNEKNRERGNESLVAESSQDDEATLFTKLITEDRLTLVQETQVSAQRLLAEVEDATFLANLTERKLLSDQDILSEWWGRVQQTTSSLWQKAKGSFSVSLFKIGETPITTLGIIRLLIILTVAWSLAHWLHRLLIRIGSRGDGTNISGYYIVARLSYYLIILTGFMMGLSAVGIDFTNFALVAGALAIGLGFGLQSIVNNFVSGLILLFERSLKVGDFVELQGGEVWGEVREINVRATIITNNDNVDIVVPNSEFMSTKVMNWTLTEPYRRVRYPFKVAYHADKELVRAAVVEAAESLPHTLRGIPGRNPAVWLVGFGEFCYQFELVVWLTARAVKRPNAVHAAYMWEIDSALKKYGFEVPLPQQEIRFHQHSAPVNVQAQAPVEIKPAQEQIDQPEAVQADQPVTVKADQSIAAQTDQSPITT